MLKAFKEKYPESIIDFLVIDKFKDAISLSPYVDNLLLFNKEKNDGLSNLIKFAKELQKINMTMYLIYILSFVQK